MATQTRTYTVTDKDTGDARLVRATHPSHALMHVARGAYDVRVSTQDDLIEMLPAGVKVEDIKHEQQALPTE